jgi:hypothetical protein
MIGVQPPDLTTSSLNVAASAVSMDYRRFKDKLKRHGGLIKCPDKM